MEDADILSLICSFVLRGPVPHGQSIKAMSEGNLEFCLFGYFQIMNRLKSLLLLQAFDINLMSFSIAVCLRCYFIIN